MPNEQAPISPLAIALGAEPLEVLFRDGHRETVSIQLHELEEYPTYIDAQADSHRLAEFAAKQPAGWARTLHPSSLLELVGRSLDLNFPSVRRWAELRTRQLALAQDLRGVVPAVTPSPKP